MPKFLVENLRSEPIPLAIEPWAELEMLAPNGRVEFEYTEPADISFSLDGDEGATVGIDSDWIKVVANGLERMIYPFGEGSRSGPPQQD